MSDEVKQCKKCSLSFIGRYCKPCRAEYLREYRKKNPDYDSEWVKKNIEKVRQSKTKHYLANKQKVIDRAKQWAHENKEKEILRHRVYRIKNAKKCSDYSKMWNRKNKDLKRIYTQNRRAKERENGGDLSPGLENKLFELQKGKCACCRKPLGGNFQLDHIMPIALGGKNEDSNIQLLTSRCNKQKHAKHPVDFMQSKGFLL
jgi:5-methylcytosine-specific restriction endonuclease McrA